jgi:peptidyl-prolyl cis-trans isomerase D
MLCTKEYFKANPAQAQFLKIEKDRLNAKIPNVYYHDQRVYTQLSEGKFKYEMESNKVNFAYVAGFTLH